MKNRAFFAMLLVLTLLVGQFSIPMAVGEPRATPCQDGYHTYYEKSRVPGMYGGRRYFTVKSCAYYSGSHDHYYIRYYDEVVYKCSICGVEYPTRVYGDDLELGQFCTKHDTGK